MFRLTRRYKWCRKRIDDLERVLNPSERFILVVAFTEKNIRRVFMHVVKSSGRSSKRALKESRNAHSLGQLNYAWKSFDNRKLEDVLASDDWNVIHNATKLRNELIHGEAHRKHRVYRRQIPKVLKTLDSIRKTFKSEYRYSGWKGLKL